MYQILFEIFLIIFNWEGVKSLNDTNETKKFINTAIKLKNWKEAELKINQIAGVADDEPEILANLGLVLFQQNKIDDAMKVYNKIINSKNLQVAVEAEFQLAHINLLKGDTMLAISNLENTLRKDFRHKLARNNLEILKIKYKGSNQNKRNPKSQNSDNKLANENIKLEANPLSNKVAELERIKKINLTENQIKHIFDALTETEKKYIEQRKIKVDKNNGNFKTW